MRSPRSWSKSARFSSSQRMCSSTLGRIRRAAVRSRFFSAVIISTSWRRRATSAAISRVPAPGSGLMAGRIASAKWANTRASRASVLASFPAARAKSRTCLGLTTATGSPEAASSPARVISTPPVASSTTSRGISFSKCSTTSPMPWESWETCHISPVGRTATSRRSWETSMPTNNWTSCIKHLPADVHRLRPSLALSGLCGPVNRSGSEQAGRDDPAEPRSSRPRTMRSATSISKIQGLTDRASA